jgi:hypothetical protein
VTEEVADRTELCHEPSAVHTPFAHAVDEPALGLDPPDEEPELEHATVRPATSETRRVATAFRRVMPGP